VFNVHLLINKDVTTKMDLARGALTVVTLRLWQSGKGLEPYISVKQTFYTCRKSNSQRNQTDGIEAVTVGAMWF
jgi:hypothetical protein